MQFKKAFYRKYLLPFGLVIILFIAIILLVVSTGPSPGTWKVYALASALAFTALLLFMLVRQTYRDEAIRQINTQRMEAASEKYKSLLETSAVGTLMIINREIVYANFIFLTMSGYTLKELLKIKLEDLIHENPESEFRIDNLHEEPGDIGRTLNFEAVISGKRGDLRDVVLAASKFSMKGKDGIVLLVKDMTGRDRIEQESIHLTYELQSSIRLMNLPVASFIREHLHCDMDTTVHRAAALMEKKKQNAIIVYKDPDTPVGIVTDTDLRNRVVARQLRYDSPVVEIMSSPIIRIDENSLLYEAILRVTNNSITHLAVEDKIGRITGIFSNEDMLEVQRNSISYLIREVNAADTVESLKKIHNKIPVLVNILMEGGSLGIRNITYMISTVTDAITRRLIEFAIDEMGDPPARFAFMALGSEGRREQTLVTDQDNAIIFEDVPNEKMAEVNRYFLYFGKKINLWLDRIGYQYCKGEVMAGNPQWCQPLLRWKKYFSDWVNRRSKDGILGAAIFFDFRIVYGSEQYGEELRKHIHREVLGKDQFFGLLARETATYKIPTNLFRNNPPEAQMPESFNIKNAISPMVDFVRVYSVQNGVSESESLLRLEKLFRLNVISESDYHEIENMFCRMMKVKFRSQVRKILANQAPDNIVSQDELTALEQSMVRKTFSEIKQFQEKIMNDFCA